MTSARRRRIVIVDDDAAVLHALQRQLDTLGWETHPAASAREALSILRRLGGVEALLTDIEMPGMGGMALRHEVVSEFPETAVILMSGGARAAGANSASDEAPIALQKPFTLQALAAALEAGARSQKRGEP